MQLINPSLILILLFCSRNLLAPNTFLLANDQLQRNWTGNIRELRNVVERLIILGEQTITKSDVELFA